MRAANAAFVTGLVAIYILVNLPLFRVLAIHDLQTILPIIGHAPNQFLFLAMFFPVELWVLHRLNRLTRRIFRVHPAIRDAPFVKWLVHRGGIVATSILIGVTISLIETYYAPPDFYHHVPDVAAEAAELNKRIMLGIRGEESTGESPGSPTSLDTGATADRARLRAIYKRDTDLDLVMIRFEAIELAAVGFVISVIIWIVYLYIKMLGYAKRLADEAVRERLRGLLLQAIPLGVLAVLAALFWPPFRAYNIYEITLVVNDYEALQPGLVYGFAFVVAVGLMWLHYSEFHPGLITRLTAIAGFLASGALMGWAEMTPETMVGYVGSGMGVGDLFMLMLVTLAFGLFGLEIAKQLEADRSSSG